MKFLYDTGKIVEVNDIPEFSYENISFEPGKLNVKYDSGKNQLHYLHLEMSITSLKGNKAINQRFEGLDIPRVQLTVVLKLKEKILNAVQKLLIPFNDVDKIWKIKTKTGNKIFLDLTSYDLLKIIHTQEETEGE